MATTRKESTVRVLKREGNLSDRIYAELRSRLQKIPMGPDERLIDLEVAEQYGTSRMPARDALLRLANEGYLVGTTRGFVRPVLSLDDVRDIFEVRRMLEPQAIASVAKTIDGEAAEALTKAILLARKANLDNDGELMTEANMAFRHAWLSRVRNKRLADTIARFVDHVQTVRLKTLSDEQIRRTVTNGLEGLYEALMTRNEELARSRMVDFMISAEEGFFFTRQAEIQASEAAASASSNGAGGSGQSVPQEMSA